MSNGSTFVSTHYWANNVCQFDLSPILAKDDTMTTEENAQQTIVSDVIDLLSTWRSEFCRCRKIPVTRFSSCVAVEESTADRVMWFEAGQAMNR